MCVCVEVWCRVACGLDIDTNGYRLWNCAELMNMPMGSDMLRTHALSLERDFSVLMGMSGRECCSPLVKREPHRNAVCWKPCFFWNGKEGELEAVRF